MASRSTQCEWFGFHNMTSQTSYILSQSSRKRDRVQHLQVQTLKTLGLIRLTGILLYTNHESGKFQRFHVQTS